VPVETGFRNDDAYRPGHLRKYMDVQLTVIGSSPAWPNPGSAHSGYVVEGGGRLLLDCGPGVLARLRTNGLLDVEAIAITHFHLDHWGDLVPWVWMSKHGTSSARKPALWLPPTGRTELGRFAEAWGHPGMFDETFDLVAYEAGEAFDAAGFRLTAYPMRHYDIEAYGFRVECQDGRVLAYSGDTGPCDSLPALARGADLFLCEATLETADDDSALRGHLSGAEALAAGGARTVVTHRPVELPTPEGAERAVDGLVLEI